MQLSKFYFIFAALCSLAPNSTHPVFPLINQIVRITEWKKAGYPTVTLCSDQHNTVYPRQEQTLIRALAQKKDSHVYVEDWLEHVGDNTNQDKVASFVPSISIFRTLLGIMGTLKKAGISSSNVECRMPMRTCMELEIPHKESIEDYKNIVDGLKTIAPKDPVDVLSNKIIEEVEAREKTAIAQLTECDLLTDHEKSNLLNNLGDEIVDVIAFKKLCNNNDGFKGKYLIAGVGHCDNIGLLLEQVGYKNTRRLEEDSAIEISDVYKQFLPQANGSAARTGMMSPVSPEQIKKYFKNPNKYTMPEAPTCTKEDWELNLEGLRLNRETGRVEEIAVQK